MTSVPEAESRAPKASASARAPRSVISLQTRSRRSRIAFLNRKQQFQSPSGVYRWEKETVGHVRYDCPENVHVFDEHMKMFGISPDCF